MATELPILKIENINIFFKGNPPVQVVKNLNLAIHKGETLAVVGESGSGKSLTALAIMGLLPPKAFVNGKIDFSPLQTGGGHEPTKSLIGNTQFNGNQLGIVFQEPMSALNPVMKVGEQIQETIEAHREVTKHEARQQVLGWLGQVQFPDPESAYNAYPHELSGGQKQRIMIAMAMCNRPSLLIADEPTTALDVTVQREVVNLMRELQRQHQTAMLFITHDIALAAEIADKFLVLYKGEVVEQGTRDEVLHHPKHPYTKALLACKPAAGQKGQPLPIIADFLGGNPPVQVAINGATTSPNPDSPILLSVDHLKVWYPKKPEVLSKNEKWFKAVDDVSFNIKRGTVTGLAGESGCGKSTISKALLGLVPITGGEISLDGKPMAAFSSAEWKKWRSQVQLIFQDPYASLNPRMTVGDALREPMVAHRKLSATDVPGELGWLMDLVQLPIDALNKYPHEFSGGQRQRIGIARALAVRPQLLICDESVSALDVSIQAQILNLLRGLQRELSLTMLFISHDLNVVHYISDQLMIMEKGKIVEQGDAGAVFNHPQNAFTQRLLAAMPENHLG